MPVREESVSHCMHKWTPSHKCIVICTSPFSFSLHFFCIVTRTCCWNPVTNAPASNRRFAYTSTGDITRARNMGRCATAETKLLSKHGNFSLHLCVFFCNYYYYYYVHLYWAVRAGEESYRRATDVNVISSTVFLNILYVYKNLH